MATRWVEQIEYSPIEAPSRPALRLVETAPVKQGPPSWMIAPTFRAEANDLPFQQTPYVPNSQVTGPGPYPPLPGLPKLG